MPTLRDTVLAKFTARTFAVWDAQIKQRGIDSKYPDVLTGLITMYERKLPRLESQRTALVSPSAAQKSAAAVEQAVQESAYAQAKIEFRSATDVLARERAAAKLSAAMAKIRDCLDIQDKDSQIAALDNRLSRITDKLACCYKEDEFRRTAQVIRNYHHTDYFIDLNAGNDANTGLSIIQSWRTIEQYTSVTVRAAGDRAFVRANTTEIPAGDINIDEDGTASQHIEIIGCDAVVNDPWADGSNVKPIIDFNSLDRLFYGNNDDFWDLRRLDMRNSADAGGFSTLYIYTCSGWNVVACDLHDAKIAALRNGLYLRAVLGVNVTDCTFYSNATENVYLNSSFDVVMRGCTFNGGPATTDYGINDGNESSYEMVNCSFGVTTAHDLASINYGNAAPARGRALGCTFADATELANYTHINNTYSILRSEDHDGVKGAQRTYYWDGIIDRSAATQIDGLDSILMQPNANTCANHPLTISKNPLQGDYQIWLSAAVHTVTIKARETIAWAVNPTATEFYFEASYLSGGAGSSTRSTQASAQGLDGVNEVSFTMTFTPTQSGWAYITCYLKDYEVGRSVNVSVKPGVS